MQKRARRKEGNENSLVKVIAEMHNTQLETMEAYQKRSEEFMLKLEQEQRKLEEDSKRGDQEFFFRMAELQKIEVKKANRGYMLRYPLRVKYNGMP